MTFATQLLIPKDLKTKPTHYPQHTSIMIPLKEGWVGWDKLNEDLYFRIEIPSLSVQTALRE